MVFSIVTTALVFGIAYFHWVQGLFGGIISVVLALIASTMAVGYSEAIATGIMGGKFPDAATAIVMCVTFCLIYGIGRMVFDSMIPGNVRLPLYLDAVGGGVCGLIVGIVACGTLALAMESMPFGPAILMNSRYTMADDHDVTVNGSRRQETAMVYGALEDDLPDETKAAGLWVPVDTLLTDYVAFQSDSGALAGSTKLRDRHQNLVRELFLQRVGIENSAKRTALNIAGRTDVNVTALFAVPNGIMQMDGENPSLSRNRKLGKIVKADADKVLLVARVTVAKPATEADGKLRFSTGSIRLVANGKDFTPLGTLYEPGRVNLLMNNRADDYLIASMDPATTLVTVDLAFMVDRVDLLADPTAKDGLKIKPGTFVEVKRFARVDLSEKEVPVKMPTPTGAAPDTGMLYKKEARDAAVKRVAEASGTAVPQ